MRRLRTRTKIAALLALALSAPLFVAVEPGAAAGVTITPAYGSGGTALGRFQSPKGMDMTPDGHLYVVEHSGERVQEFQVVAS